MTKEQKLKKDQKTLKKYEKKLKKQAKAYMQTISAVSINQRKARAAALGECALQAIEKVKELARTKPLMNGTLDYMIQEEKYKDESDGKKYFRYSVSYRVVGTERAFTDEQIMEELKTLEEQLAKETAEMFPETPEE